MRFCFKWVDGEYTSRKMRREFVQIFHCNNKKPLRLCKVDRERKKE